MSQHKTAEINPPERPEKNSDQFKPEELQRYPEKKNFKDVPLNKKMEAQFKEKNLKYDRELQATRDKKAEIVEKQVSKDFPLAPEKRSNNSKDLQYADSNEFSKEYKIRDPSAKDHEIQLTEGFYDKRDEQAYVREGKDDYTTALHEKLHQKSKSELPTRLNEGITEHNAKKEAGWMADLKNIDSRGREIPKTPSDYEKDVQIAGKLEATVGRDSLNQAYFEGRTDALKKDINESLGDGSYDKITNALEKGDYEAADKVFDKKKK